MVRDVCGTENDFGGIWWGWELGAVTGELGTVVVLVIILPPGNSCLSPGL